MMTRHIAKIVFLIMMFAANGWCETTIYKCKNGEGAYLYQKTACGEQANTVSSWAAEKAKAMPAAETTDDNEAGKAKPVVLTLKQTASGHYFTDGSINDKPLSFVVDTGASFVSLPEQAAHGALIYCDDKVQISTANGKVDSCTATVKKLKFGPFTMQDVTAIIQPNLDQPLLGMNILRLFKIEQNSGEMNISVLQKNKTEAE